MLGKVILGFLVCSTFLLPLGCDSPGTSINQSNNMGTPDCPLCGEWETPNGGNVHSKLLITPDQVEMRSHSISGLDCSAVFNSWESFGDLEGVIRFPKDTEIICSDGFLQSAGMNEIKYILGKYSLIIITERNVEELYVRTQVEIPEQPNPLLGKWGVLNADENPEDYKGKWVRLRDRIWFKKDSTSSRQSMYIRKYIVEDERVIMIYKNGSWRIAEFINQNTILLKPDLLVQRGFEKEKKEFTRIE